MLPIHIPVKSWMNLSGIITRCLVLHIQPAEHRNPIKKQEGTDRKIHQGKHASYSGYR